MEVNLLSVKIMSYIRHISFLLEPDSQRIETGFCRSPVLNFQFSILSFGSLILNYPFSIFN